LFCDRQRIDNFKSVFLILIITPKLLKVHGKRNFYISLFSGIGFNVNFKGDCGDILSTIGDSEGAIACADADGEVIQLGDRLYKFFD
jgi:hypothetical protein